MGIKSNKKHPKITQNQVQTQCSQKLTFSFEYLTTNKKFNLESLDKSEKANVLSELFKRLAEISKGDWLYWNNLGKNNGIETIPFNEINFSPNGLTLSKDEKIIVFRFNSGNGRILGVKGSSCAVYNIIGFDTKFNAYNHGK